MSKDANVKCREIEVSCNFWIRSLVFFYVESGRSGAIVLIFCMNNLDRV